MKYVFHRRRRISFLCLMAVILGLSVKSIIADAVATYGPYKFVQSGNLLQLSEYDVSKNPSGEVYVNKKYSGADETFLVVGIQRTAFQKKSLASLTVDTTVVEEAGYTDSYSIDREAFLETEIGLSSDNPKAIFQGGEITAIGKNAFERAKIGCDLIFQKVNGGINSYAFKDIEVAGTLEIQGSLTWLDAYALEGARMQGLILPDNIQEIGQGAFKGTQIKEWTVPENLEKLGSKIFEGCTLTKITLPSSDMEREIAEDAFPDQCGLTIVIPKGLTDLSVFHFEKYKNLTFQTDSSLTEDSPVISWLKEHRLTYKVGEHGLLVTPDDISGSTPEPTEKPTSEPTEDPTSEPTESPAARPTVEPTENPSLIPTKEPVLTSEPKGTAAPMASPVPDRGLVSVPVEIENNSVQVIKNIRYKIKDNNNVEVTGAAKKELKKFHIPDTVRIRDRLYKVTGIQNKAFKGMKKLQKVSIGNYVKAVGNEAFANCPKLKRIQFGTGVKQLGKKVLYRDGKLKKIIFKGKKLKKIGKQTFYGVSRRVDIRAVRSKVKYYTRLIRRSKK